MSAGGCYDPARLSTSNYPILTSVSGRIYIAGNPGLTTYDNAFPRLTRIGTYLHLSSNPAVTTLGDAFPVLVELGTDGQPGAYGGGISLYLVSHERLTTLGTAFASLRRIRGALYINGNPLLTDFEALRNLECHGGPFQPSTCQGCPGWLLAKPRCQL